MEIATRRREQEVWQACDDLWALYGEMKGLTGDSIRDRLVSLGKSKGSPNEIYRYRKTWAASRKVNDTGNVEGSFDDDPISRAVRMVHENLKLETNEQIDKLKEEFAIQIKEKNHEIDAAKQGLQNLLTEFSDLQKELLGAKNRIQALDEQLLAEIDLRKATEKELALVKALKDQDEKAHVQMIKELKSIFEQEMKSAEDRYQAFEIASNAKIDKLTIDKAKLGQEFSDQLNSLKVTLYNHEIAKLNWEKIETALAKELDAARAKLDINLNEIKLCQHDNTQLLLRLASVTAELENIKKENSLLKDTLNMGQFSLKKAAVTIARLRASLRLGQ